MVNVRPNRMSFQDFTAAEATDSPGRRRNSFLNSLGRRVDSLWPPSATVRLIFSQSEFRRSPSAIDSVSFFARQPVRDSNRTICFPLFGRCLFNHSVRSGYLKETSLIVVKLGTGVLTDAARQPDLIQMKQLVAQIAGQHRAGREIVLVTSGAVGSGMGVLGHQRRPTGVAELQACAAVGQSRLMTTYQQLFAEHQLTTAQVLLTHDDLEDRDRHLNARNTLVNLLEHKVIPIINEMTPCRTRN